MKGRDGRQKETWDGKGGVGRGRWEGEGGKPREMGEEVTRHRRNKQTNPSLPFVAWPSIASEEATHPSNKADEFEMVISTLLLWSISFFPRHPSCLWWSDQYRDEERPISGTGGGGGGGGDAFPRRSQAAVGAVRGRDPGPLEEGSGVARHLWLGRRRCPSIRRRRHRPPRPQGQDQLSPLYHHRLPPSPDPPYFQPIRRRAVDHWPPPAPLPAASTADVQQPQQYRGVLQRAPSARGGWGHADPPPGVASREAGKPAAPARPRWRGRLSQRLRVVVLRRRRWRRHRVGLPAAAAVRSQLPPTARRWLPTHGSPHLMPSSHGRKEKTIL